MQAFFLSAVVGGFFYVIEFDLIFRVDFVIFTRRKMSKIVYIKVKRKDGSWRHVPHEIFTQEEAAERGIVPLSRTEWRERFFDNHENLTGQYILTDDVPSLVAPILECYVSNPERPRGRGGYVLKLYLPWTFVMGRRRPILFGVKVGVVCQQLKARYARVTLLQRKLFILLIALGCGHNEAVFAIWGLDQKVDRNWFRKKLMADEKTLAATGELAKDVFTSAGASPDKIAEAMWKLANDKDSPATVRKDMLQDIANRTMQIGRAHV